MQFGESSEKLIYKGVPVYFLISVYAYLCVCVCVCVCVCIF